MIRNLAKSDYARVIEIWERAVRATHHFLNEEDILQYRKLIYNKYLDLVELYGFVDEKGVLSGFIGISGEAIQLLFVDANRRGMGVGKQLVAYAVQEKGSKTVDVNEQNEQAVHFYEHLGFVTTGRSPVDDAGKPYPILSMELKDRKGV